MVLVTGGRELDAWGWRDLDYVRELAVDIDVLELDRIVYVLNVDFHAMKLGAKLPRLPRRSSFEGSTRRNVITEKYGFNASQGGKSEG